MAAPQSDGGQWDMLCALISKYGVMPKAAMPESFNSATPGNQRRLKQQTRHDAVILRDDQQRPHQRRRIKRHPAEDAQRGLPDASLHFWRTSPTLTSNTGPEG